MRIDQIENMIISSAGHTLNTDHPTFLEQLELNGRSEINLQNHVASIFETAPKRGIPIVERELPPQWHETMILSPLRRVLRVAFLAPESAQMLRGDRQVKQTVTIGVHDLYGTNPATGKTYECPVNSCDIITTLNVMRHTRSGLVHDAAYSELDGKQVLERLSKNYPVFRSPYTDHASQRIDGRILFDPELDPRAEKDCALRQAQMSRVDINAGLIASLIQVEEALSDPNGSSLLFPASK